MRTVYVIMNAKKEPVTVALSRPKVLRPGETAVPVKLRSGHTIYSWSLPAS